MKITIRKIEPKWEQEINSWIAQTLSRVGMKHLKIGWSWNKRHYDIGLAFSKECRIEFSEPLWAKATPAERYETVVHEVCHITADRRHGKRCIHGPEWRDEMRLAGFPNPQRCHDVDAGITRKKQQRIKAQCGCGAVTSVGPTQAQRIQRGQQSYHCTRCKDKVTLIYKERKDDA